MQYRRIGYRYTEVVSSRRRDPFAASHGHGVARPVWRPPTDVFEDARGFVVRIELAGTSEGDIAIEAYTDTLLVTGSRACPADAETRFHNAEIRYGRFRVEIDFPVLVEPERTEASLSDGMLEIVLPRRSGGAA